MQRTDGGRAVSRGSQHCHRVVFDRRDVARPWIGLHRRDQMPGEGGRQLRLGLRQRQQMLDRGQVATLEFAPRRASDRDLPDDSLHERVAAGRGVGIRLDLEERLRHQPVEESPRGFIAHIGHRCGTPRREPLAEHGAGQQHLTLVRVEPIEPRGDERPDRRRHRYSSEGSAHDVSHTVVHQNPLVGEGSQRLDGVQRHSPAVRANGGQQCLRRAGHRPGDKLVHLGVAERLELDPLPRSA